ncbi:MAG: allophanate hydrolase [Burkholderiales bacterium]
MTTIASLRRDYLAGNRELESSVRTFESLIRSALDVQDDVAWISLATAQEIDEQIEALRGVDPRALPLYGIPFAVKDNIDVAGWITTAACPDFAYRAERTAECVERLLAAGAILMGKTNLDQFATGLVGTRSPYGAVPNPFDSAYVSGGSSSGSASVVSRGLVCFSLGTDTAGSGRIPAGFQNIIGLKPTPGLVSTEGVLPACRTLDCVSVFALTVADANTVLEVLADKPPPRVALDSPGSVLRIGIPGAASLPSDPEYARLFGEAVLACTALAGPTREIDMHLLDEVAALLYDGPWIAERYVTVRDLIERSPISMDPIVAQVIGRAKEFSAADAFAGLYRLEDLRKQAAALWETCDLLLVPTAPVHPTMAQIAADPVGGNSQLGRYTNFVNLLGWCAIAVPAGFTQMGLPFGVTFIAPAGHEDQLVRVGLAWQSMQLRPPGLAGVVDAHSLRVEPAEVNGWVPNLRPQDDAQPSQASAATPAQSDQCIRLAVVGAHLRGMQLHHQLVELGCRFLQATETAAAYRLYALAQSAPPKPGLVKVSEGGNGIQVEVYEMPLTRIGSLLAQIPQPLGLGTITLADGSSVKGFICEPCGVAGARDITHFGGWRAYIANLE